MIDLHAHTTASDGTDAPAELVQIAIQAGIRALAITDHDTMDGCAPAETAAAGTPLRLIAGVELSTRVEEQPDPAFRSAHLLGYFPAGCNPDFPAWLEALRSRRRERNEGMIERLRKLGFEITLDEVSARARNIAGRPHFAQVLLEKGYCDTFEECFERYLGERGLAFVERADPPLEEGVARIRNAGGVPVLAHPVRTIPTLDEAGPTLKRWAAAGLAGVEVWHPSHDVWAQIVYWRLAGELGLAATGGSDYHGVYKPALHLGWGRAGEIQVPGSVLEDLDRLARYAK